MIHIELHGAGDHLMFLMGVAVVAFWVYRSVRNSLLLGRVEREASEVFFHEGDPDKLARSLHRIGHAIEPNAWPDPPPGEELQ